VLFTVSRVWFDKNTLVQPLNAPTRIRGEGKLGIRFRTGGTAAERAKGFGAWGFPNNQDEIVGLGSVSATDTLETILGRCSAAAVQHELVAPATGHLVDSLPLK
jgi:hypothetical protein